MIRHTTHCALRLGDNLAHLHFLRKLAEANPGHEFTHYAHNGYLGELRPVVEDMPQIKLRDLTAENNCGNFWERSPNTDSVNAWKNTGGYWENHPLKYQYAEFMLSWFHHLAGQLGLASPLQKPDDLLFDYPALRPPVPICDPFDFLVVNSRPMSNQAPAYNLDEMECLIGELARKYTVVTTHPSRVPVTCTQLLGLNVTQIGQMSQRCKYIVMVSTGPSWPTFNVWNKDTVDYRVIIIEREWIGLSQRTEQRLTASGARQVLQWKGLL